jgi:hypothetical protein
MKLVPPNLCPELPEPCRAHSCLQHHDQSCRRAARWAAVPPQEAGQCSGRCLKGTLCAILRSCIQSLHSLSQHVPANTPVHSEPGACCLCFAYASKVRHPMTAPRGDAAVMPANMCTSVVDAGKIRIAACAIFGSIISGTFLLFWLCGCRCAACRSTLQHMSRLSDSPCRLQTKSTTSDRLGNAMQAPPDMRLDKQRWQRTALNEMPLLGYPEL